MFARCFGQQFQFIAYSELVLDIDAAPCASVDLPSNLPHEDLALVLGTATAVVLQFLAGVTLQEAVRVAAVSQAFEIPEEPRPTWFGHSVGRWVSSLSRAWPWL